MATATKEDLGWLDKKPGNGEPYAEIMWDSKITFLSLLKATSQTTTNTI